MKISNFSSVLSLLVFWMVLSPFVGEAQQKIKVKLGDITGIPSAAYYVAIEKGFFAKAGLDVEHIRFIGGGHVMNALAARQIDFGTAAPIPFLYYLTRRHDIVAIMAYYQSGTVRYLSGGWVNSDEPIATTFFIVRRDSPLRSIKDLKGRPIAGAHALGTWPDLYTKKFFKAQGMDAQRDTTYTTLGLDQMSGALGAGTVDAVHITEPFYTPTTDKYGTRILFTDIDVEKLLTPAPGPSLEGGAALVLTHREFLKQHPEAASAFLTALRNSLNWTWRNLGEAKRLVAKYNGVSTDIADRLVINPGPRKGKVSFESLQRAQSVMLELGALKAPIEGWPEKHFDYSSLDTVNTKLE